MSMWTANSDLDYYEPFGSPDDEPGEDEYYEPRTGATVETVVSDIQKTLAGDNDFALSYPQYAIGDVVEYRDQETGRVIVATVLDLGGADWYDVHEDGTDPELDPHIHASLIQRIVPWEEYLAATPRKPAAAVIADVKREVA